MSKEKTELLPCPCCHGRMKYTEDDCPQQYFECLDCGMRFNFYLEGGQTEEEVRKLAIHKMNTRAIPPAVDVESLKSEICAIVSVHYTHGGNEDTAVREAIDSLYQTNRLNGGNEKMKEAMRLLDFMMETFRDTDNEGPWYEGWQSNELMRVISDYDKLKARLGE